ncbi:hypothetical protein L618_008600000010 [Rhodococcus rhodochrous J45]|uniref:Uncharacterized protein n=1 Tax=Rhodococcus rhodochrous J45 TaxID=935266 RepID=A0A562D6X4_RHORH|nr:hypothetical protein [Rhodococcus rhodochrous]TWH05515.1 hypothetical protein L618_008600000010 [Rhodococcus rhodochrous J45]
MAQMKVVCAVVTWRSSNARGNRAFSGDIIDVGAAEAKRLRKIGAAVDYKTAAVPVQTPASGEGADADVQMPDANAADPVANPDGQTPDGEELVGAETGESGQDPEPDGVDLSEAGAGVVERPLQSAPKATWVAYAMSRGIDKAEAESLSRPELIARLTADE